MRQGRMRRSIHVIHLNPSIDFESSCFMIVAVSLGPSNLSGRPLTETPLLMEPETRSCRGEDIAPEPVDSAEDSGQG